MKKTEIQELLPEITDFFNQYIRHQYELSEDGIPAEIENYKITPEHIRILASAGEQRTACFTEIGESYFEYQKQTSGESIYTPDKKGFLILLYSRLIHDEDELIKIFFHEAGHVISTVACPDFAEMSGPMKVKDGEIIPAKYGGFVWSECIAEAIATRAFEQYMIQKEEQDGAAHGAYVYQDRYAAQELAFKFCGETFSLNGKIDTYTLGLYIAYLITDPTLESMNEEGIRISLGFDRFERYVSEAFADLTRFCDRKLYALDKENADNDNINFGAYWMVDYEWLAQLGSLALKLSKAWMVEFSIEFANRIMATNA